MLPHLPAYKSSHLRQVEGFTIRERVPTGEGPFRMILLLHGWTGDVNSMWVFANRMPHDAWLVAPQAPYPSARGGFSWRDETLRPPQQNEELTSGSQVQRRLPSFEELLPASERLLSILDTGHFPGCEALDDRNIRFDVVGFSQGGALAMVLALLHPDRIRRLAGLSTFMPPGGEVLALRSPLQNLPALIAHGSQDSIVPVQIAQQTASLLEQAGAEVGYCESEVGHKLGSDCFYALEKFMR